MLTCQIFNIKCVILIDNHTKILNHNYLLDTSTSYNNYKRYILIRYKHKSLAFYSSAIYVENNLLLIILKGYCNYTPCL